MLYMAVREICDIPCTSASPYPGKQTIRVPNNGLDLNDSGQLFAEPQRDLDYSTPKYGPSILATTFCSNVSRKRFVCAKYSSLESPFDTTETSFTEPSAKQ